MAGKRAIFLDRDGVINQTIFRFGKPRAPFTLEELELFPGVPEAVTSLKKAGMLAIVVTNQPDVARGWVTMEKVMEVNGRIQDILPVDEIMCCFHVEVDKCECRKPRPGMLLKAAGKYGIDLNASFMVGDRYSDIEAGKRAGCRTVLVGNNEDAGAVIEPDHRVPSLGDAVEWILSHNYW